MTDVPRGPTTEELRARVLAQHADPYAYVDAFGHELACTHCAGEGTCDDNANPLWDCDDSLHPCHSCGGSGKRRDQTIF